MSTRTERVKLYREALRALRQAEAILITNRALAAKTCPDPLLDKALAKTRHAIGVFTDVLKREE